jgi:NAD(P)-dependent dehydrogenase (short-subunit alcohol dehydrogenase family)
MSILITGGGSGIGEGSAEHFVARGARVTISGRRADRIEAVARRLGPACRSVVGDVTDDGDRARMVDAAVEHGAGLDVLINNAANMYRADVDKYDEQELLDVFHSNVVAPMMLTRSALPHLVASRGCVILLGSVHTTRAFPNASPYAATKGALEVLTRVLAAELGPMGVRVGCVRPGAVATELNVRAGLATADESLKRLESLGPAHVLGRIGTPAEVAEAFEYLARAEWVTGNVLVVDGGLGLGVTNA